MCMTISATENGTWKGTLLLIVQVSSFDRERQHSPRQWCENLTVPPSIINRHGSFQIPPIRIYVSLHNSEERLHVKCYMSNQFLHSFTTLTTYWRGWIFSLIWIRSSPHSLIADVSLRAPCTIMWLLHPWARINENYTTLGTHYVPLWLHYAPSGCLDLRSTASLWGIMHPSGHIMGSSGVIISITPHPGAQ